MDAPRAERWLNRLRWVVWIGCIAAVVALAATGEGRDAAAQGWKLLAAGDVDGLQRWAAGFGWAAPLVTAGLMVAQALAAPIPAVVVTAANALLFGWFWGGLWSCLTATLAAGLCFQLAQALGEPWVRRLVSAAYWERTQRFMDRHGALAVLAARLTPWAPFDPISYLAGLTRMRFWTFCWATFLGQLPAGMLYSYLAVQLLPGHRPSGLLLVLAPTALLLLLLVGWAAQRRLRRPQESPLEPPHGATEVDPNRSKPESTGRRDVKNS